MSRSGIATGRTPRTRTPNTRTTRTPQAGIDKSTAKVGTWLSTGKASNAQPVAKRATQRSARNSKRIITP